MNHAFCVFVRIASTRRFLQIPKTYVFLKNNMGLSMKNTRTADFCADRMDVITNFAVITITVVKRVHCSYIAGLSQFLRVFVFFLTLVGFAICSVGFLQQPPR